MTEEITVDQVRRQLADVQAELDRQRTLMRDLLKNAGDESVCRACGAAIYFVMHPKTQRAGVYDADGLSHFIRCTDPERFRKKRGTHGRDYPTTGGTETA